MKNKLTLLAVFCLITYSFEAQIQYNESDTLNIYNTLNLAKQQKIETTQTGDLIAYFGMKYLGTQYRGNTLTSEGNEQLVVKTDAFDCVTFVEHCVALAQCLKFEKTDFATYTQKLENLRYYNGKRTDYASRLHYSTYWLFDNCKRNNFVNITEKLPNELFYKNINYMSKNRIKYKPLADDSLFQKILIAESELNMQTFHFIPKTKIAEIESQIETGDVIIFTTDIEGLDCVHVGLAVNQNSEIKLLHASSSEKKIVLTEKTISQYTKDIKNQTGIMILRAAF